MNIFVSIIAAALAVIIRADSCQDKCVSELGASACDPESKCEAKICSYLFIVDGALCHNGNGDCDTSDPVSCPSDNNTRRGGRGRATRITSMTLCGDCGESSCCDSEHNYCADNCGHEHNCSLEGCH